MKATSFSGGLMENLMFTLSSDKDKKTIRFRVRSRSTLMLLMELGKIETRTPNVIV